MDEMNYENYDGKFATITQAAETLGVSRQTGSTMVKNGDLPYIENEHGRGIPALAVNKLKAARVREAYEEYERLMSIPPLKDIHWPGAGE